MIFFSVLATNVEHVALYCRSILILLYIRLCSSRNLPVSVQLVQLALVVHLQVVSVISHDAETYQAMRTGHILVSI